MLLKIREKSQGVFSWIILILICVPFALWGLQNYTGDGKETPIATIGDKEFFQRDLNKAYEQFSQQFAGRQIPEEILKQQALNKLVQDEVLLQYVQGENLVATDDAVRAYIQTLQYFQTDGRFDKKQYQTLLASQNMSSAQFANRIRTALVMEQFQRSVMDSSFATEHDIKTFYKIQNQQRSIELATLVPKKLAEKLSSAELQAYYDAHQQDYKTSEQVSIEYLELSLDDLAAEVEVNDEALTVFYEERKDDYVTKEGRKISHILFVTNDKISDKQALEKATKVKARLATEEFANVAAEVSEDKLTAKTGGDLGVFVIGEMDEAIEKALESLKQGEITAPVKTPFGYHLVKITESIPSKVKALAEVKDELKQIYQRAQAENRFYELGETLTEVSYENSDNLTIVADAIGIKIKKTALFTRDAGESIATEASIRNMAFSDDVLKGSNSEPVELGTERIVVLRMLEYKPAASQTLAEVQDKVKLALTAQKVAAQLTEQADKIKQRLLAGESLKVIAEKEKLEFKVLPTLARNNGDVEASLNRVIFTAAKPVKDKPTILVADLAEGKKAVVSLLAVIDGKQETETVKQRELADVNIARVSGQQSFAAIMKHLQDNAEVSFKK